MDLMMRKDYQPSKLLCEFTEFFVNKAEPSLGFSTKPQQFLKLNRKEEV